MRLSFNLLIFVMSLQLFGCDSIVEVEIPKDEEAMVLNCALQSDTTLSVSLTSSTHILDPSSDYKVIANAEIRLVEDEERVLDFRYFKDGQYRSTYKALPGKSYSITVNHPDYSSVSASLVMPETPALGTITSGIKSVQDFFGGGVQEFPSVNIEILDTRGPHFYTVQGSVEINIRGFLNGIQIANINLESPVSVLSDDPLLSGNNQNFGSGDLLFNDELFDDSKYLLNIYYFDVYDLNEDPIAYIDSSDQRIASLLQQFGGSFEDLSFDYGAKYFKINFGSMTEDLYRYQLSRNLQNNASGNPFSQPVQVSNNISNGFGVFGGLSFAAYSIQLN